jgi:hypothetical protein
MVRRTRGISGMTQNYFNDLYTETLDKLSIVRSLNEEIGLYFDDNLEKYLLTLLNDKKAKVMREFKEKAEEAIERLQARNTKNENKTIKNNSKS